jgi:hypothetical protein
MKTPSVIRSGRRLALPALVLLMLAPLSAKEEVHLDFKEIKRDSPTSPLIKCYQYSFGDWGDGKVIDLKGRGALVQAPTGKGGLGENSTMLRLDKTPQVDLEVIIGNANQATAISFGLTDKDGTEQTWQVPIEGRPRGTPQRIRLDLTKPSSEQKPGKTPGMDLKKLSVWQVRGDYSDRKVEVLLVRLIGQR